jgi:site-specific recombinase XerD
MSPARKRVAVEPQAFDPADLRLLLESWCLDLTASRRAPSTVKQYRESVLFYIAWCEAQGEDPDLSRDQVKRWQVALFELGRTPATVLQRQAGVKRFSRFLAAEGEIERDDLAGLPQPQLEVAVPEVLTDQQVAALLATCDSSFYGRRDAALIRFLLETMCRCGEALALEVSDLSLKDGVALVRHSKTRKARLIAFGPATARALDKYLRLRRSQRGADSPAFWLGTRGEPLRYGALYVTMRRRALRADPPFKLHPHTFRSTGSVRFRAAGGSVSSLLALAGWSSIEMAARYVRAAESEIAIGEARRLDLGLSFD